MKSHRVNKGKAMFLYKNTGMASGGGGGGKKKGGFRLHPTLHGK